MIIKVLIGMGARTGLKTAQASVESVLKNMDCVSSPVRLIAVSKTFNADHIKPVLQAGHCDFGENRVQEAYTKWPELKKEYPKTQLHLIGPLQTNKVKAAIDLFDVFHTLDREKLAQRFATEFEERDYYPEIYIQVNIGEEEQKSGIMLSDVNEFIFFCKQDLSLNIVGLMAIPPLGETPAPFFALLAKIAQRNNLHRLSMGMSGDYEVALRLGATDIRLGSAIFGARD